MIFNWELHELIPEWVEKPTAGIVVSSVSQDSREVQSGCLFIARTGMKHKGIDFVQDAVDNGAVAVLVDKKEFEDCPEVSVPVVPVTELNAQIGPIAARFYHSPSESMRVVGITGTNGKTSCAHFTAQAMNFLGVKTAIIGTVGNGFPDQLGKATHTTPDAIGLQRLFADLKDQGADAVVMEVSSHALEQARVAAVDFDFALFTNLSRDHLDYHGDMESYGNAKSKLFKEYDLKAAVINHEDEFGRKLLSDPDVDCKKVSVGRVKGDYVSVAYRLALKGIEAEFKTPQGYFEFSSTVIGDFNLDNLLLVAAVLSEQGFSLSDIEKGLTELESVPGRMQAVVVESKPLVIIDYAHTPDALEKALHAAKAHTQGALWCVFGCGGDRDQGKRSMMGNVADLLADHLVVTSDNPRSENPESIISMIKNGIKQHAAEIEADRANAIRRAINEARAEDVVLIAGKGHEDYQEINGERLPFSDLEVSQQVLGVAA
ncbi:MAG: UDP-N-acetylmuramoyl-L-alanyl-D-glutamate--2,6-diaminopimelate ligase [Neptuniibacter sp.]